MPRRSTVKDCRPQDMAAHDDVRKAFMEFKEEVFAKSSQQQDFKLPDQFCCVKDAPQDHTPADIDKLKADCNVSTVSKSTQLLRHSLRELREEVLYQCTIIQDFSLPSDLEEEQTKNNLHDLESDLFMCSTDISIKDNTCGRSSVTSSGRQKKGARAKREQDKERKRRKKLQTERKEMESNEKRDSTDHNIGMQLENMKQRKNMIHKIRYNTDPVYREQKLAAGKERYKKNEVQRQAKKESSKEKYQNNEAHRESVKRKSFNNYAYNKNFQQNVKTLSKKKYHENYEHREQLIEASKQKYRVNTRHRSQLIEASKQKYRDDIRHRRQLIEASKQKYRDNTRHCKQKKEASKQKYRDNISHRKQKKEASKQKYHNNIEHREKLKQATKLQYRESILIREKYRKRLRDKYKHDLAMRQRKILLVQQRRVQRRNNLSAVAVSFRQQVRDGPRFVCCVCHKFKFRKQVVLCNKAAYSKKGQISTMAAKCISDKFLSNCTSECKEQCEVINHNKQWICYTCHCHLLKGEMPADAEANSLKLPPIPEELQTMNKLERQLISLRIPFMKLVQLPKGGQRGIVGPCVSVPTDIEKTTSVLPRCDSDNQLIRCKLKRKLQYKGHSQYEFVSSNKIRRGLEYLQQNNSFYSDITLHPSWCESLPSEIADLGVEDEAVVSGTSQEEADNDTNKDTETQHDAEEDQSIKDRGTPSDTCLQPVDIGQEILDQHFDDIFCLAPGEGNTPVSMLQETGNEAMSFPVQFSDGVTGTYDAVRPVRLTRSRYLHARLLNADSRFSSDPAYIFYAQYLSELEQVISKVSIALRKSTGTDATGNKITAGMLTDRSKLKNILSTDQGYKFLTPIRGTPPYWQSTLRDLMAMIRQLGIPTWFCTFSAADMRWTEILQVLLEQQGSSQTVEDLDWTEKCEVLKNNPIMNAVMFDHRFHTFLKQVIIERRVVGKIKDHFHRIEFQQRGSPHAHCLFWVEDAPLLDKDDDQTVCEFVDRFVTCQLPDKNEDPELHEIASSVQQHSKNHSKTCKKKGTTCRFHFPRPPSERTFVSRTKSLTDPTIQRSPLEMKTRAQAVLQLMWDVIQNVDLEEITTQNLFAAAGITQKDFEEASNILTKRTNIVLQRKPTDVWINQYNSDLLRCWNANIDIQYVTDAYSCVMYIISYISKSEREMGLVLENVRKEASEGNADAQQAMKKIGGAYFRQREVSAQEAAYRVCGLHLKETSRKVQFVPTGDNQVKMSLPLNVIQRRSNTIDESEIWMSSLYDKYKARPLNADFDRLCYASFCSEYRVLAASQVPKKPNPHVHKLQNDLGHIQKRSRTEEAVVRYPRFSAQKNSELHYKSTLQLFLPHRMDGHIKPGNFKTHEEFYLSGAVSLTTSTSPESVKDIVDSNRQHFEKNVEDLDEAQDLIDKHGPMEDAWALIAPESEAERLEAELEKEVVVDESDMEIPELETTNKRKSKGTNLEISNSRFTIQQMQPLLRKLNKKQKRVFYSVRQWCLQKVNGEQPDPFRIFITGGAGTGKSHLIKCLYYEANRILSPHAPNPDDIVVLLTAPTATAAFNIDGTTLHQAFSLTKSLPLPYIYKSDAGLNTLRVKLQNLVILVIDEISMVGQRVLTYVSERLRQIKQSGNALFGNVCVIAVGDFYQLPPVKQMCLYDPRPEHFFPLWSSNFSLVELDQIMRQKDDSHFAELLNRLRVKKKKERLQDDDLACLEACVDHSLPPDTLHIFATNREVNNHNSKMIDKICEATQTVSAQDFDKDPQSGKLVAKDTPYDTSHDYLPSQLLIGPKARVMLIRNVDISLGLVNGACGTVSRILPPSPRSSLPRAVQVVFDNEKVGKPSSSHPKNPQPVSIEPFEETLKNNAVRHQLPLRLAWGCTTHKVQGITTDKAVVSFKRTFAAGMAYVALSRVTSMDGLVIQDLDQDKIYCTEQISDALKAMPQYLPLLEQEECRNRVHILLHNIQGLIPHIDDMRMNSDITDVNFICLTETWMEPSSTAPALKNYDIIHRPRFLSYSSGLPLFKDLKQQKHGGVGIYFRKNQMCRQLVLDQVNIECVGVYVQDLDASLVVVYRPESYTASVFLEQLHQLLLLLPQNGKATIIVGDFNQDVLKSESSIKKFMEQHGFRQMMDRPTTDGGTLIDHVYMCGTLQASVDKIPAYYSYHDIVSVKVQIP